MSEPPKENDIDITPSGRVKSGSGAGVNFSFESQKEQDEHQDWLDKKEAAKRNPLGVHVFKVRGNSMR